MPIGAYFSIRECWICDDFAKPHVEAFNWYEKLLYLTIEVKGNKKRVVEARGDYEKSVEKNVPIQVCIDHWVHTATKLLSLLKMRYPLDPIDPATGEEFFKLLWAIDKTKKIKDLEILKKNVRQFTSQFWYCEFFFAFERWERNLK